MQDQLVVVGRRALGTELGAKSAVPRTGKPLYCASMPGAPRSSHGRFQNLDGSGAHLPRAVFRWAVLDRLAGRRRRSPATAQIPPVPPDPALIAPPPPGPRIP